MNPPFLDRLSIGARGGVVPDAVQRTGAEESRRFARWKGWVAAVAVCVGLAGGEVQAHDAGPAHEETQSLGAEFERMMAGVVKRPEDGDVRAVMARALMYAGEKAPRVGSSSAPSWFGSSKSGVAQSKGPYAMGAAPRGMGSFSGATSLLLPSVAAAGVTVVPPPAGSPGNAALMAAAFGPFKPKVRYYWDATTFFLESDNMPEGMPNRMVGITAWQQQIPLPASYLASTPNPEKDVASLGYGQPNYWRLPLVPVPSASPITIFTIGSTANNFQRGAVALASNGVAIFNPANNRGEVSYEIGELDYYGGHCGLADDYHYHIIPTHLLSAFGGALSNDRPVAWALDGYPIYGYVEPDGGVRQALDAQGGHDIGNGWGYHYHAIGSTATDAAHPYGTPQSPYMMTAFHGTVVNYGGQVDGQAEVSAIRSNPSGGYEAKAVAGASIVAFKNPVALATDASGHLLEDPAGVATADQFLMRVSIAGVTYDECWRINRAPVSKTVTVTWRLPSISTTTTTYNSNGSRLTAYPLAAPSLAKLPDTGQTADSTTSFGEDADYTINAQSFTDNGNGTVTDNVTGLMWQKNDSGECTWENAVANAALVTTGGYTDWRLPTPAEIFSLFTHNGNPALNTIYFPESAAEYWWTGDVYGASTTNVWCANKGGGLGGKPKSETLSAGGTFPYHARYVRGAKASNTHNYVANGDGTVTDQDTGLMWTQVPASARTWEAALSYAEGLTFAGASDWRLPNIKELQTLTDYTLATATSAAGIKPSMNRTLFAASLTGCALTLGSTTVTCADTTGLLVGMPLVDLVNASGAYLSATTPLTVTAVNSGTSFTMSAAALKTGTGLALKALALPTAYWSSTSLSGKTTEAWLLETGINTSVPASAGPTRTSQGIISYESKTSVYPVFAVRTTTVATQIAVSESGSALSDGISTVGYSATVMKTFTVKNNGVTSLTLNGVSIDGADAVNFALSGAPVAGRVLAAGESVTFGVLFGNASAGTTYTAALHIASSDTAAGAAFDVGLSGAVAIVGSVVQSPAGPANGDAPFITAKITAPTGKALRANAPVQLVYKVGSNTTATVFSETMAKAAVSPWDGTNADNLWDVVTTAKADGVQQAAAANHTTSGAGVAGLLFTKGSSVASASQAATRAAINAAGPAGADNAASVEFYAATVNPVDGFGWNFQLAPDGVNYTTRLSETTGSTGHGFQLYHYDLPDADRVATLKMRFQFTGPGTGGSTASKVYIDDIVVKTTTGVPQVTLTMFDDGLHGDGAAGDGVYGAQIPAQAEGAPVGYSVVVNYSDATAFTLASAGGYTPTAPLALSTGATLAKALTSAAYTEALAASGGTPGYTWSVTSGALPPGVSLSNAGVFSGTATAVGTFTFTATVTDSVGHTASQVFTLTAARPPNVVVIVTDDQGWADIGYHTAAGQVPIPTPNMDSFRTKGIRLEKFYPTAVCSMTRSTLLTGRNCIRMGVNNGRGLDLSEHMMPQTFKAAGYQTYMCGKWHLGGSENNVSLTTVNGRQVRVIQEGLQYAPYNRGWDVHYGSYSGSIDYFTHWSKEAENLDRPDWWLNGVQQVENTDLQGNHAVDANGQPAGGYSVDLLADKAVSLIQSRDVSKPMMLYLAFNGIHASVQAPASYVAKYGNPSDASRYVADPLRRLVVAAVDCMDVAMGRVLTALDAAGIADDTIVVFFSDNGGNNAAGEYNTPLRGTKTDAYDGGIHTPAGIRWPGKLAAGITSNQYVWVGDLFPTLCAATGVTPRNTKPFDGANLWPALQSISEANPDGAPRGVPLVTPASPTVGLDLFTDPVSGVSKMFKLIYSRVGTTVTNQLFNLTDDPYETTDLVLGANASAYGAIITSLTAAINAVTVIDYPPYIGPALITNSAPQGGSITLYAPFTSSVTPSVQWRRNGQAIAGATSFTQVTDQLGALVSGAYTTTLTLSNLSATDAASYDVVVTNSAGSSTSETGVVSLALDAPVIADLPAFTKGTSCTLQWPAVAGATSYSAQVSNSADFASVLGMQTSSTPSVTFSGLVSGTTYYYRATATDGSYPSGYSNVVFSRQDAVAPLVAITSPTGGTTTNSASVMVQGTASDALSGVSAVMVNGVAATTSDSFAHWTATVPLAAGMNKIVAVAYDGAQARGNAESISTGITLTPLVPVVSSVATGPTAPTYLDPVWVTALVQPSQGATLTQVRLSYDMGTAVSNKVFQETFPLGSINAWFGTGAANPWITNATTSSNLRLAVGTANHTAPLVLSGCSTTAGSAAVTCASTAGVFAGMTVTGSNIAPGTKVASVGGNTALVLSSAAIGTGTGLSLTVSGMTLTNCTTTSGSTTVTCDSTVGLVTGMALSGTGLASNSTVSAIPTTTSFVMSKAPTTPGGALTVVASGTAAEFRNGTANLGDTQFTTASAINASAAGGYVEFYLRTRDLAATNNCRWAFQVSADGGATWNTRLSEAWDTSTVNLTSCVLNATGSVAGSTVVTCASTTGLTTGRTISGPVAYFTGNTTNGSAVVSNASTGSLAVGMFVSGAGIANGTRILSIEPATGFTMSANATATGTAVAMAGTYFNGGTTVSAVTNATTFVLSTAAYATTSGAPIAAAATTLNHDFKLYHYDLAGAELGANLKLRFQSAGYTPTAPTSSPLVDVDDIIVATTAPPVPVLVTMFDDGLHGDGAAGDGVYGAQIPAQAGATLVNYRVIATDSKGLTTTLPASGGSSYTVASTLTDATLVNAEFLTIPSDRGVTLTAAMASDVDAYIQYGTTPGVYTGATTPATFAAANGPLRIALSGLQADTKYYYRLRYRTPGASDYVARGEHSFRTARPRSAPFKFTITADPHLDFNTDPRLLAIAMGNLLADQPDFHIDLGDIFMTDKMADTVLGVPAEYGGGFPSQSRVSVRAAIFRNYFELACHSVPYFYTLGNHEAEYGYLFNAATDKQNNIPAWNLKARKAYYPAPTPDAFYKGNPTPMDYPGGTLGLLEDYYAWEWGDALFIVLDPFWNTNTNPNSANDAWHWTLGKTQYDWLKATLQSSGARYRFVFMHHIVGGTTTLADGVTTNVAARGGIEVIDKYEWGGRNADGTAGFAARRPGWDMPIHNLLVANHVSAVFHGHDHLYAYQTMDGLVYLECPQPGTANYVVLGSAGDGKYTQGVLMPNSGHIRVTVARGQALSEYVRSYRPEDETATRHNRDVSHSFTMAPWVSTNASLSGLALSVGSLSPAFSSAVSNYTASVGNVTTSVTVTPSVTETGASVKVNGVSVASGSASGAVNLAVGLNTISVQVTAADGVTTTSHTVAVTRLSVLEGWRQTWFGSAANTGLGADSADPYGTGLSNLVVYGLLGPGQNPATARASQLPQPVLSAGAYTFTFTEPAGVSGVTYGAEWTSNLSAGTWAPMADTGSGASHRFSMPTNAGSKGFMRLKVTRQ